MISETRADRWGGWKAWTLYCTLFAVTLVPVASIEFAGWSDGLVFDDGAESNSKSRVKRQEDFPDSGSGDYFITPEEFYRFRMQIQMPYTPAFDNKRTGEFMLIEDKLKSNIEELYRPVLGKQTIRVAKIEPVKSDPQFINVTVDLSSEGNYNQEELKRVLKRLLDNSEIEGVPVTYEAPFNLSPLPTGGVKCSPTEFQCEQGECIPESRRCDGTEDCNDASDERDCVSIEMRFTSPVQGNELRSYVLQWDIIGAPVQIVSYEFQYRPARSSEPWKSVHVASSIFPAGPGTHMFTNLEPNTQYELIAKVITFEDRDGIEVGRFNFITKGCVVGEFACRDGQCISEDQKCDGRSDCRDGSDEENCSPRCAGNEFQCGDRTCIRLDQVCDNYPDCRDRSDETNCSRACQPSEYRCGDGTCIDSDRQCDGTVDCSDRSDEAACPCRANQFECADGSCIPLTQECDGRADCRDGSDEFSCGRCRPDQFECRNRQCIPSNEKCDGTSQCSDRSDEENCPCRDGQFRCLGDGRCIEEAKRCDGVLDCNDASDENNCTCRRNEFSCGDGNCLRDYQLCDGNYDCTDGRDERNCRRPPPQPECDLDKQYPCDLSCIPLSWRCNGIRDCEDGNDELFCPCRQNTFDCLDGTCISDTQVCDGTPHCTNSLDENNCTTCRGNEFTCRDNTCIDRRRYCDRSPDCPDGSDEIGCPCPSNYFTCGNGQCIEASRQCNGVIDCNDYTDEQGCPTCASNEFMCGDRTCISSNKRCDRIPDCSDRSDEAECASPCQSSEFDCGNGDCIPISERCDLVLQCQNGNDEYECNYETECQPGEFSCDGGRCVSNDKKCDGFLDCRDYTDEDTCPCSPGQFTCANGQCIPELRKCDNQFDCTDRSDEEGCQASCQSGQFQCGDGTCIDAARKCDRSSDCRDNSDELNCPTVPGCQPGMYECRNGQCVGQGSRCNGRRDCIDGSDEDGCTSGCPPTLFECRNGQCVPQGSRCNGRRDCIDGSDEDGCTSPGLQGIHLKTYPPDQTIKQGQEVVFQCRDEGPERHPVAWRRQDGQSMPPNTRDRNGRLTMPEIQMRHAGGYVCYATNVPPNTPDSQITVTLRVQQNPNPTPRPSVTCGINEATCNNGDCIPKNKVCDKVQDCVDGSDERRCPDNNERCHPNEFACDNTRCVMKTWRCDGDDDCGDDSDESNCEPPPPNYGCNAKEFKCTNADQCIPKSFHCDGETDCFDGSDETGCSKPIVNEIERMVMVQLGATIIIRCRAIGIPTPVIVWRRNWGHVPDKCNQKSVEGHGTLTCPNAEISDQGAYTCEALNIKGSTMGVPDTILKVKRIPGVCVAPYFNDYAKDQNQCEQCFCFGVTTECDSSKLFLAKLPPPERNYYQIVGAMFNESSNSFEILTSDPLSQSYMTSPSDTVVKVSAADVSRLGGRPDMVTYFALPSSHLGDLTKSYGGSLEYMINFKGPDAGRPSSAPDVILQSDGDKKLYWMRGTPFSPNVNNRVNGEFAPGQWYKEVDKRRGYLQGRDYATRSEIMMVLQNVRYFLIRAQYQEERRLDSSMADIQIDTAVTEDTGGGQAVLVEECRCPPGYTGLSCQRCAPGYDRKRNGVWLGLCERTAPPCAASEYYDPRTGNCKKCPCIGSEALLSCNLDNDGGVTCNCPTGYTGRRCERCDRGFVGNPTRGEPCVRPGACNQAGTEDVGPGGDCRCKDYVTGERCDRCQSHTFSLSASNPRGCVTCFCMGITRNCSSSSFYRNQVVSTFSNDRNGFELVTQNRGSRISDDLEIDRQSYQLKFTRFGSVPQDIYYWKLPTSYLGNKLTSYGGELKFTVRYSGGGESYRNVPDIEIEGNGERLLHYIRDDLSPDTDHEVSVRLVEDEWKTFNQGQLNRENMLMALANVDFIIIKATYTNSSREVRLSSVSMDTAEQRNTGQERAHEVEECRCPPEYTGLSCENCRVGYWKGGRGLYLGKCEACQCNNHADSCNQETGVCENCRDNTEGDSCERCIPGYEGDAILGYPNSCKPTFPTCECDLAGSLSSTCPDGYNCQCKDNVVGTRCNQCRPGTFNLDASNPQGCTACFCSGVIEDCTSEVPPRAEILRSPLDTNHGYILTDRYGDETITDGIIVDRRRNELGYSNLAERAIYYWSLPRTFTGKKLLAYGGTLAYTQRFESVSGASFLSDIDVALEGNGVTIFWNYPDPLQSGQSQTVEIPLRPSSEWLRMEGSQTSTATRYDFLKVFANIESIHIRASFSSNVRATFLSDVRMELGQSSDMERCSCPVGYAGRSCEECGPGYYRDLYDQSLSVFGACKICDCNRREERCFLGGDGQLKCECRPEYSGQFCEIDGSPSTTTPTTPIIPPTREIFVTVREPKIQIINQGDTARFYCEARTRFGENLPSTWSRQEGLLPVGRYISNGQLVITDARQSDSGTYICSASDGTSTAQDIAFLTVGEGPAPPVDVFIIPSTYEGPPGQDVRVECRIESAGSVQWSRAQGRLPQNAYQSNGFLTITSPTRRDGGEYICTAIFSNGLQRQQRITIIITSIGPEIIPPTARIEPERQDVPQGTIAELRCIVTGTPQPRVTWTKTREELPNRAQILDSLLRISGVQVSDRGMYKCEAQNAGGIGEAYAILEVEPREPPAIEIYPESTQSILIGGNVLFQCRITQGIPRPALTWRRADGRLMPSTASVNDGVLRFTGMTGSEGGIYECNAVNQAGNTTAIVTLTVQSRPDITIVQPSPYRAYVGQQVTLECRASGDPPPSVHWVREDYTHTSFGSSRDEISNVARYQINNVQKHHEGVYKCVANNAAGLSESRLTLVVDGDSRSTTPRPPIDFVPKNTSQAKIGSDVHFICILEGAARGDYVSWEREGAAMPINHILSGGNLYINDVQRQDAGTYTCVVLNSRTGLRKALYRTVLELTSGLRVELNPKQQVVSPGEDVYLRCEVVSGTQPVNIRWEAASGRLPNTVFARGGVLEFRGIRKSDAGLYRCIATNSQSQAIGEAEVNVRDPPVGRPSIVALQKQVRAYVGQDATLQCETEAGKYISWRRDRGLPPNVFMNNGILRISRVQMDNAGRYTCLTNLPGGRQATDFIDLIVERVESVDVKIISSIPTIKMGDVVYLLCEVKGDPSARVEWSKVDSDRLPSNVNATGPRLKVENVRADNGGLYRCSVTSDSGKSTYKDFVFTIVDVPSVTPVENVRRASYGSTVVLKCENNLTRPVSFSWTKQGGRLPPDARVAQERLSIPDIRAEDAGTYICTSRNAEVAMDIPIILVVTDVVPYFSQAQNSYISFAPLRDAYLEFDIELSLRPENPDGLILYSSKEKSRSSDFLSLGLRDGFPEFKFDLGAGPAVRTANQRLTMGEWHTMRLKRNRKNGSLEVDGSDPFSITAAGHHQGLDLYEPLYLGGLPDFSSISRHANYIKGFQGCISRLVIGGVIQELMPDSQDSSGITSCDSCGSNPCLNRGMCQEAYTHEGFKCICAPGFAGPTCREIGEACFPGACGEGRCENKPEGGFECYCPLGKSGNRCERDIVIFEPAFAEGSYAAYPTPLVDKASLNRMEFGMNVMPKSVEDGLLMYCAQRENGKGDFTSLAIKDKRVEFRFDTGSGPAVLRSKRDIRPGDWINIKAERQFKHGKLVVNRNETTRGKSPGGTRGLNLRTPLYVGGVNKQKVRVSTGTGVESGFTGCVSEFQVAMSSLDLDMIKSVTDAANVGQCQDRAICERHPGICLNGAACVNDVDEEEGFRCVCAEGFSGRRCEKQENMCSTLERCQNGGSCRGTRRQYKCICPLGFYGENCQIPIDSGTSALFNGQGFMEFPKSMFSHRNYLQKEIVSFDFSTTASNGLMFWHGQGENTDGHKQDFVALAVVDGYVQFGYQLGSGIAQINSTIRVNDGKRHSVTTVRKGRNGSLTVDGVTINGSSTGFLQMLNTAGNIYLGGVPRQNYMTGDMYEHGFSGCIESLNIQNGGIVDLYRQGSRASDVQPCDRDKYNGQDASINEI